jgi:hypothetical protein
MLGPHLTERGGAVAPVDQGLESTGRAGESGHQTAAGLPRRTQEWRDEVNREVGRRMVCGRDLLIRFGKDHDVVPFDRGQALEISCVGRIMRHWPKGRAESRQLASLQLFQCQAAAALKC